MGLGGAALLPSTYAVVFTALRMPMDLPFATLWQEFTDASESTRQWRESFEKLISAVSPVAWWISPALLVLGLAALVQRGRDFLEPREPHVIDVVLILAAGIYAIYLIKLAGLFPKYHITALPFICLAAAWLVGRVVGQVRLRDAVAWALVLIVITAYYWRVPVEWFSEGFGSLDTLLVIRPLMLLVLALGLAAVISGGPFSRHLAMVTALLYSAGRWVWDGDSLGSTFPRTTGMARTASGKPPPFWIRWWRPMSSGRRKRSGLLRAESAVH